MGRRSPGRRAQGGHAPWRPGLGSGAQRTLGRLSTDFNGVHIDGSLETLPGAYERYYALLRDALLTGGPPPVDPAGAVASLRVIEAAQQSASTGTVVSFP